MSWQEQLIMLPVLLPLLSGALLIPIRETRHGLKLALNLASCALQLLVALELVWLLDTEHWPHGLGVYLAANWSAPFGIVLLADRLSALMLLLTAVLALAVLMFSMQRWSRIGVHFHSLYQFLLMGLNGAFLTHDLFNLFVFFEVLLAASYGLVLHGYNLARIRAGMQYISINLLASLLFLIGVALIYASTGTLNMSDLGPRHAALAPAARALFEVGFGVLVLAFLSKAALWPLGFWLAPTYAAASPPAAALLVLLTKVGVYALLRLWPLVFMPGASLGSTLLTMGGLITLLYGSIGMLASQEPGRLAGHAALISSGTLLAALGLAYGQASPTLLAAALFYLLSATLALAAYMLLIELIARIRTPGAAMLALTMEAFAIDEKPEDPVGVGIPAGLAFMGLAFFACALIISGLPPLSGFVAKFSLLHALLQPAAVAPTVAAALSGLSWALVGLLMLSGLCAIIALMRFGVRTFWAAGNVTPPQLLLSEVLPVASLLALGVGLSVLAGPSMSYLTRLAEGLLQPAHYVEQVLGAQPRAGVLPPPALTPASPPPALPGEAP